MSGNRRVMLVGTFDVENYGDLLFPAVAAHELGAHGIDVIPVSPTSQAVKELSDAPQPVAVADMLTGKETIHGVMVGGGYIVHHQDAGFLQEYERAGIADWAYAGLWLGATLAGVMREVPVVWNAPGVPVPFGGARRKEMLASMLRAASYVSVRDPGSVEFLGSHDGVEIRIVPDTVLGLARVWPRETLADAFGSLAARKQFDPGMAYFTLHPRQRSWGNMAVADLAAAVDAMARELGLIPMLIAIGRSLADAEAVKVLSSQLRSQHVCLDDPLSLKETAAAIAHGRAYVGASMHGYVTACAYDVPGAIVARPAHRKFGGLVNQLGRQGDLTRDWADGLKVMARNLSAHDGRIIPASVHEDLDRHWTEVRQALGGEGPQQAGQRFLADYAGYCVETMGAGWAFDPFVRMKQ